MTESISESSASCGGSVNLSRKLMSLTTEITCRVVVGKSSFKHGGGFDVVKFQEQMHEAHGILGSFFASDFFPCVGWIVDRVTGVHGRLERIFDIWDAFYQQVIDDHLDSERGKKEDDEEDIVDVLLKLSKNAQSSFEITHDHIKAILMVRVC